MWIFDVFQLPDLLPLTWNISKVQLYWQLFMMMKMRTVIRLNEKFWAELFVKIIKCKNKKDFSEVENYLSFA